MEGTTMPVRRSSTFYYNTTSNKSHIQSSTLPDRVVSRPSTQHKNKFKNLKNSFHTKAPDFKTTVQEFFAFSRQKTKQLTTKAKQSDPPSIDGNPFNNDHREIKDDELLSEAQSMPEYRKIHKNIVIEEDDNISSTESENDPNSMKDKWTLIKIITDDKATKYILNDTNKFLPKSTVGSRRDSLQSVDKISKDMDPNVDSIVNIHADNFPGGHQKGSRGKKGRLGSTHLTFTSRPLFPKVRNIMDAFRTYPNASSWKVKGHTEMAGTSRMAHGISKSPVPLYKREWHSNGNVTIAARNTAGFNTKYTFPQNGKYFHGEPKEGLFNYLDPGKAADDFVQTIHSPDENNSPFSNEVFIGNQYEDDIVHSKPLLAKGQKRMGNHKIKWLPLATATSAITTKKQMNGRSETVLSHSNAGPEEKMFTHVTKKGYTLPKNDIFIPKRIRNMIRGTFQRVYTPRDAIKGSYKRQNIHSVLPIKSQSFATGQFQTAVEHISLLDETDRNTFVTSIISTTTTTLPPTTTSEPRSTRKPETITISGLFPDSGDIWQTIGKNPKPILFTPSATTMRPLKRFNIGSKATDIKSISWATVEPLQELVVHSENDNLAERVDKLTSHSSITTGDAKHSGMGLSFRDNTNHNKTFGLIKRVSNELETNNKDMVSQKKREYEKLLRKFEADLKKKNLLQEKDNFILSTTLKGNSQKGKIFNKQTTTLTPQRTAITQAKIKHSSNKDIMWGKCCFYN